MVLKVAMVDCIVEVHLLPPKTSIHLDFFCLLNLLTNTNINSTQWECFRTNEYVKIKYIVNITQLISMYANWRTPTRVIGGRATHNHMDVMYKSKTLLQVFIRLTTK
jgi:hypothetical protein